MHSFRTGEDRWFRISACNQTRTARRSPSRSRLSIKSTRSRRRSAIGPRSKKSSTTTRTSSTPIRSRWARQMVKGKAVDAIVAWTNEKAGARSFSTTIGHNTETVADARYLDLITRGLLWACDKLTPDYLTPFKGQNKVTFVLRSLSRLRSRRRRQKTRPASKRPRAARSRARTTCLEGCGWR
jgi:hypothetical protein